MSLHIEKEYDLPIDADLEQTAQAAVEAVIADQACPYECEVSLFLVDNETIRRMNREYRQIDRETDVLSFPMLEAGDFLDYDRLEEKQEDYFDPETGELVLGDIVVSLDKVAEQAHRYGHSQRREYAFLIVHSMLHLFGWDHLEEQDAAAMEERQRRMLADMGIER